MPPPLARGGIHIPCCSPQSCAKNTLLSCCIYDPTGILHANVSIEPLATNFRLVYPGMTLAKKTQSRELHRDYPNNKSTTGVINMYQQLNRQSMRFGNSRYDDTIPFQAVLETPTPDGWHRFTNPAEGRPYYWSPDLRTFTESDITQEHTLNRVIQWSRSIASFANQSTRRDYDIVLKVSESEEDSMGACSYYLVDYASEVVFWLREVSNTALGLPEIRSPTHLKLLLSEQFWVHCEYTPPPHMDFRRKAKELLATLGTLCIDASSSTGSVSPFHQDECELYSRILTQVLSAGQRLEINWCLAQSRIINLFGERNARTDRNVVVNGQKAPAETTAFVLWSTIMFSIPCMYLARWNAIWVDRVTYTREWKKLMKEMLEEFLYGLIARQHFTAGTEFFDFCPGTSGNCYDGIHLWGIILDFIVLYTAQPGRMCSRCCQLHPNKRTRHQGASGYGAETQHSMGADRMVRSMPFHFGVLGDV
ncbi:hypothetical protein B0J17DRAFT_632168 [Rhizoctonia solani]|nr:hypothetical protein B0J17DRAFT_632168 [Rhizoctonia solani]